MALIKCPECNKEFSNQAKCCPNCGFPTDEILKNISAEKMKKQSDMLKKILLILMAIFGIAVAAFIVHYIENQPDKNGYYEGLTWDTTYDEVKKKYPDIKEAKALWDGEKNYKTTLQNILNINGITADISFSFKNNKLAHVYFIITEENISNGTIAELSEAFYKKFDKAYGDGSDMDFMDTQLCKWDTDKSEITLFTLDNLLSLEYEDIALVSD